MRRLALVVAAICSGVFVMRYSRPADSFAVSERTRVRAHLDSAERELRAQPVTGLSVSQRAARARALDRLHEYWVQGVFPKNTDFPGERVPYFIDRSGTRCAMAHLIEQSGHGAFVARVAATDNNARIPELKNNPQLLAWLSDNGLTLEEAARIQPAYCDLPPAQQLIPCYDPPVAVQGASSGYKTTTSVSVGADVLAVVLNTARTGLSPRVAGALGIASGVVGIAVGAPNLDRSGSRRTLGFVNVGVGAVSAAIGVHRLTGKRSTVTPVSFTPWFSLSGAPGLSARVAF